MRVCQGILLFPICSGKTTNSVLILHILYFMRRFKSFDLHVIVLIKIHSCKTGYPIKNDYFKRSFCKGIINVVDGIYIHISS